MKNIIKSIVALVASLRGKTILMANALDYKAMLFKLLGVEDSADESMVNERYTAAMKAPTDEDAVTAANELKEAKAATVAANALVEEKEAALAKCKALGMEYKTKAEAANEAKTTAETNFANERKERSKLLLDAAVTANKITLAKRKEYDVEFANVETFDATLTKLNAEKGTNLPAQRQAGMANIGSRRAGMTPEDSKRQETIATFANEIGKRPVYEGLTPAVKYQKVMLALQAEHPELYQAAE